jgi:hypothetical protein
VVDHAAVLQDAAPAVCEVVDALLVQLERQARMALYATLVAYRETEIETSVAVLPRSKC